ncbi:DUF3732 domain-containing protein [Pseudomonas mosselii]|uniref:DUF3732 domain-containing protein n=1 Tax=Pseudomonas mosselii TaxID=78327 RepID=UPI001F4C3946|nr:DUF3732 domain-containing protein [Pseudomonas mosselii]MCH7420503.1 DUF3732 domain-containing protein [Pseudomonas mosselii]MDH1528014.1 DUF3732 domain-containing protein [Pseudomonas mosselii]
MKLQIEKLILWPKNGRKYREVKFTSGAVNVISGSSKAGKSAVIPIIDYCLASEKCAIPVGTIRNTCAWFGLLVDTDEGMKLFARPEPGRQRSTDDMFILEGKNISLPAKIERKNSNRHIAKDILNRLSGLPNIGFGDDVKFGFKNRPSFRDLMAFTFQPQNIVANPDVLFYKADTTGHREKLKDIFPFILGAVTPQTLLASWEMKDLERRQKQLKSEINALVVASARLRGEANSWYFRAREYGLVSIDSVLSEQWPVAVEQLSAIVKKSSRDAQPKVETIQASINTIEQLKTREDLIAANLFAGRQKLAQLSGLRKDAEAYASAVETMRDRLSLSKWLRGLVKNDNVTAIGALDSPTLSPSAELDALCDALSSIEDSARVVPVVPVSIESELLRIRNAMTEDADELEAIRKEIRAIELIDAQAKGQALREADIDRYLGRLEEAVKNYQEAQFDSTLAQELEKVDKRMAELAPLVSVDLIRANTRKILDTLSAHCAKITPSLDAEWKDARIGLSITDLAIKVRHDGRDDFLWEIGSGANWLAYHVAMLLALQKLFMAKKTVEHPVPHFLVFDQPSQVYFPVKRAAQIEEEHELNDEDRVAVRKVFKAFADAVNTSEGRLQIIVLDHADDGVWGKIPGVVLTEEWRDTKLVPDWFSMPPE